jgi:hypothetical protein
MKYSKRRGYRMASVVLVVASLLLPTLLSGMLGWRWLALASGLPFYCALIFLTYARFRDASISVLWLIPMFLIFHFGPEWESGPVALHPSGLISFLPVVVGWMARDGRAESNLAPHVSEIKS